MSLITLDTSRLVLIPLTHGQVLKYIRQDSSLEYELNLETGLRDMPPELAEAIRKDILPATANSEGNYLYSTLWIIVLKNRRIIVGDMCFKGPPNDQGVIEIGYGVYPEFRNNGYMTEAVGGLIRWAWNQPEVRSIIAETDDDNFTSQQVLVKNQFFRCRRQNQSSLWRLKKPGLKNIAK